MIENANKSNLYFNVLKEKIIKIDVGIKGDLQGIRDDCWDDRSLQEASKLVRTKLNETKTLLAKLITLAQEEEDQQLRDAAVAEAEKLKSCSQDTHNAFRNSLLKAQLAIGERKKQELFGPPVNESDSSKDSLRQRMNKSMALKQSSQLTDDLLTVTRMIQENTDKSAKTLDKLVESSQTIGSTQEELKTMGSVISQAKKILGKYGRRENTDKLLIFLGLVFFVACCLVVVRNRLNLF